MKLATYKDGSRDGQLVVVSRDLGLAHYATGIASKLQQVLDDWGFMAPQLQDVYDRLNAGHARHAFPFDVGQCMAPLPRAYQWVRAHTPVGTVDAEPNASGPTLAQACSAPLFAALDPMHMSCGTLDLDFEASVAVAVGDIPQGSSPEQALEAVRLVMLTNDLALRAAPIGSLQAYPATAFSPVACTTDELGDAWQKGRVHLALHTTVNGRKLGMCDAGADMPWHFGQLLAHLAKARAVSAGTLVGGGPLVTPSTTDTKGRTDWPKGFACLADKRQAEVLQSGQAHTDFLQVGDTLRIDMKGRDGLSMCGAIEQTVQASLL